MVDHIKLEGISVLLPRQTNKNVQKEDISSQKDEMDSAGELTSFITAMAPEETSPAELLRVQQMKYQIHNGGYKVDLDVLSEKLWDTFLTNHG